MYLSWTRVTGRRLGALRKAPLCIGDGQAPYYDFELQFVAASLPALGFRRFRVSPRPDGQCHGGDDGTLTFHSTWPESVWKVPGGQISHASPPRANVPGPQSLQLADPGRVASLPASQGLQGSTPVKGL